MEPVSVQIQTILYGNDKTALRRSMDALANAIEHGRRADPPVGRAALHYGDASAVPLYGEEEIATLRAEYAPYFSLQYRVFGFNSGTAKGHNLLFEGCAAQYLLIMNPDVVVSPRFFAGMLAPFYTAYGGAGMVEARQTPLEHPREYDAATAETAWVSGACSLLRADVFRELGGYDDRSFFLYCDDVDLSFRARLAGYRLLYAPTVPAFHPKRLDSQGRLRPGATERYYAAEAALLMAHKWSNKAQLEKLLRVYARGTEEQRKAVEAFKKRKEEGLLRPPVEGAQELWHMIGSEYAPHRFSL